MEVTCFLWGTGLRVFLTHPGKEALLVVTPTARLVCCAVILRVLPVLVVMIIASVPIGGRKQSPSCDSKRSSDVQVTQAQRAPSSAKTRGSSVDFYSSPLRLQQIAHQHIQYPAFRESFFYDETVNHVLKGDGWEPDPKSAARESKKIWSSRGRSISSRLPKTAVPPGSAFKNECSSPDRLYSSSRGSLGYEVTRGSCVFSCLAHDELVFPSHTFYKFNLFVGSLRGSSLCSTTKRFDAVSSQYNFLFVFIAS